MGNLDDPAVLLPLIFTGLMGLSMLLYVVLDGYDLGVGVLLPLRRRREKDTMIASHRPVLGRQRDLAGARRRPAAGGIPARARRDPDRAVPAGGADAGRADPARRGLRLPRQGRAPSTRRCWNRAFVAGSVLAALAQGYMLGHYIVGFETSARRVLGFALLIGLCLAAGYALLGATWLIMKTDGRTAAPRRRLGDAARCGCTALGIGAVSMATPLRQPRIFDKWFALPSSSCCCRCRSPR